MANFIQKIKSLLSGNSIPVEPVIKTLPFAEPIYSPNKKPLWLELERKLKELVKKEAENE